MLGLPELSDPMTKQTTKLPNHNDERDLTWMGDPDWQPAAEDCADHGWREIKWRGTESGSSNQTFSDFIGAWNCAVQCPGMPMTRLSRGSSKVLFVLTFDT